MNVSSTREEPLPSDTEAWLAGFTQLVATAIANAQARVELGRFAEEQAALRRVATLVARGESAEEVFATVAEEVGRVLGVDYTAMSRYEPDGVRTVVAAWARSGSPVVPVGTREILGGPNVPTLVFETGRPAGSTATARTPARRRPPRSPPGYARLSVCRSGWRASCGAS